MLDQLRAYTTHHRRLVMLILILLGGGVIVGLFILRYTTPAQVTIADLLNTPELYVDAFVEVRGYNAGEPGLCSVGKASPPINWFLSTSKPSFGSTAQPKIGIQSRSIGFPQTPQVVVRGWFRRHFGPAYCDHPGNTNYVIAWYIEAQSLQELSDR